MRSTPPTISAFALWLLAALPVQAAQSKPLKPVRQQVFERLDKSGDARLDVGEFLDGSVGRAAGNKREEFKERDQNDDGFLSFDEFRRPGKSELPDPETEMRTLDADGNGSLTLKEYLADKHGLVANKRTFYRYDTDEDGLLTLEELQRRAEGVKLSQRTLFKIRDDNDDGKLTLKEFNLWRTDPHRIRDGESQFARHDDDGDGFLTFQEFQFTPVAGGASQEAIFEKLDSDGDSRVSPDELTKSLPSGPATWARRTFGEFDTNNDGALDLAEFKARREELDRQHQASTAPPGWAWWEKLLVVVGLLVVAGVLAVLYVPWQWFRRLRRLSGALDRVESLQRRLKVIFGAARRRWRWAVGALASLAACVFLRMLWQTVAQNLEATAQVSVPMFPEPTEFAEGRPLRLRVQRIRSLGFSGDGRRLAVAHGDRQTDGAVRIWDIQQRKVIALWEEPRGIYSVHISRDGRLVASSSLSDSLVRIRSIGSGKEILKIAPGDQPARVRFSPDGRTLATASTAGELKLWSIEDGKELQSLASLSFNLQCVAFSGDGIRIVAGGGPLGGTRREVIRLTTARGPETRSAESQVPVVSGWAGVWEIASGKQIAEMKDMPDSVLGIAVSPNGKLVATAGRDGAARLWEAETGKLVSTLLGHRAALEWVDFSPNGEMLASGSYDHTAKLWSVDAGQEVATPEGHDGDAVTKASGPGGKTLAAAWKGVARLLGVEARDPRSVDSGDEMATLPHEGVVMTTRFSPDGKTLATAGWEGVVRLWDAATRQEVGVLHPGWSEGDVPQPVLAVAYSPNHQLVASAHEDKTVRLREPSTGRMVRLLRGDVQVSCLAFSPDGQILATAGGDKYVRLWDVDRGRELKRLLGHTAEVLSVAFSPDGSQLASSGNDKTIRLWDALVRDEQAKLQGHSAAVRSVAYSADGKRLASGSDDGTVKIWDTKTLEELATLTGHTGSIQAVAFSPDGKTLASAGEDKSVKLWDVERKEERSTLAGHADAVRCLAFSPQGKTLASGGPDNVIKLWDPESGERRATLRGHDGEVTSLAFAPDTAALISGSRDKTIRYWKSKPARIAPIATLDVTGQGARCRFGILSPDGRVMITAGDDKVIRVWDMQTGEISGVDEYLGGTPICGDLSPDGSLLATGTYGQTVHLWDVAAGRRVGELATGGERLYAVDFSPDGARLAVSSASGTVSVWDVESGERSWTSARQSLPVVVVVFSPDGKIIASTTYDWQKPQEAGEVKLWEADSGKELAKLPLDARGHTHACFGPDGKLLVVGGGDAVLRIWEVESRQLRSTIAVPGSVSCLALLPGSKLVLAGHYGRAVSLWDIESGRFVAEYVDAPEETAVYEVWCTPDGSLIAATGTKGTVTLWPTIPGESPGGTTSADRARAWIIEKPSPKGKPQ